MTEQEWLRKHKPLIDGTAVRAARALPDEEFADLRQEIAIAVLAAHKTFDARRRQATVPFVQRKLQWWLVDRIRKATREPRTRCTPPSAYEWMKQDTQALESEYCMVDFMIDLERMKLTPLDRFVIHLRLLGHTVAEIMSISGTSRGKIYRLIHRLERITQ